MKKSCFFAYFLGLTAFFIADESEAGGELRLTTTLDTGQLRVSQMAFLPDGQKLVSGDYPAKIWNLQTGKAVRSFPLRKASVSGFALSPDGRTLAMGGHDEELALWEIASEKKRLAFKMEREVLDCLAFSPNGEILVGGGTSVQGGIPFSYPLVLWDVATRQMKVAVHEAKGGGVRCVAFSPDGKLLASGTGKRGNSIKFWDTATLKEIATIESAQSFGVSSLAFSANGQLLASGGTDGGDKEPLPVALTRRRQSPFEDGVVKVWDVATAKNKAILKGHIKEVTSVAFSADGKFLASGSRDQSIRLWDPITCKCLHAMNAESQVLSIAFSRNGKLLASGNADGTIKIWQLQPSK